MINFQDALTQRLKGQPYEMGGITGGNAGFGDQIKAQSLYATTPEQNAEIQRRQNEVNARNTASFNKDNATLASFGGNVPGSWRPSAVEQFDVRSVLGPNAVNLAGGNGAPGASEAPGVSAAKSPFTFGQSSVRSILDRYPHTPAGLQQAFAENPELAGASKIGGSKGDKILDPSTGRWIDVIQAAGEGGKAWQWLDDEGTATPQAAMGGGGMFGGSGLSSMLQGDASAGIQQALQNIGGLNDNSRLQQLIAALSGGR
jgi:hypothetical protein